MKNTTFANVEIGQHFGFFEDERFNEYIKTGNNEAQLVENGATTEFSDGYPVLTWTEE